MSGLEALGAAASIAGILSLAGQSMKAAVALHGIYKDVATASESVRRFLQELKALIRVLDEVQNVIRELELMSTPYMLASLQIQLKYCNKGIYDWLQVAERINPESSTWTKETWKKFKTAIGRHASWMSGSKWRPTVEILI
ncbi:uncharacterized protein PAC_03331 [Phialocephala subalpina]|uniref:Azaphilone pigments biosynthesis cluster protein L N-terminal domain-containing protein n=1 Tax=Phialocephala subalpina TaxID=576137 RepID=A0A1L7WL33_9HELO|nr:uncharacterized protein PAC_03331 [Phialocephala subalpina]